MTAEMLALSKDFFEIMLHMVWAMFGYHRFYLVLFQMRIVFSDHDIVITDIIQYYTGRVIPSVCRKAQLLSLHHNIT